MGIMIDGVDNQAIVQGVAEMGEKYLRFGSPSFKGRC
jgi:hypothetical protein